jgi:hypothetical protein
MRSEQEVVERFNEVYEREHRKKLDEYLTAAPINCKHIGRYRVKGNGIMGFCGNPSVLIKVGKPVFVCQDIDTAKHCPCYECHNSEASVTQEFLNELKSPSICGQKYPKLAMLLWFLQRLPSDESNTRRGRLWTLIVETLKGVKAILLLKWM